MLTRTDEITNYLQFKCGSIKVQLSGYWGIPQLLFVQDIPPLLFVLLLHDQRK